MVTSNMAGNGRGRAVLDALVDWAARLNGPAQPTLTVPGQPAPGPATPDAQPTLPPPVPLPQPVPPPAAKPVQGAQPAQPVAQSVTEAGAGK
jgi:D-alanyl-D-alanine carboxypeptidase/D-alanyl-D-alanine-endopeptidase (penicillin-binding protein 4)